MSRRDFVVKNVFAKWVGIFIITILQFVSKRIFIEYFSDELLGLSGLLQSVIAMLSLLELGVGSAIYYSLYEPLATDDKEKITAIMSLYKKIYTIIGFAVLLLGIGAMPFLHMFIDTDLSIFTVRIAYFILLIDTSSSYFLAYRRNIFNADQKEYFCTNIDTLTTIFSTITQVLVTIVTHNYYLYLAGKVVWTISANIIIYYYSTKKYGYLKSKIKYRLSKEYMLEFKKNVKTLCISNISSYLVFSTDNILISTFVSLNSVFIYSNYSMIISTINKLFHNIFNSAQASVGNFVVSNSRDKSYDLFNNIFFANYLVTCFTSVALILISNSFIRLWLGKQYVWPLYIVIILIINNYLRFISQTVSIFRNAIGLYSPYSFYKYWGFVEGIFNLVASVLFIKAFKGQEILGVFLGTTVSTALIFSFAGTHALFKYFFGIEKLKSYIETYIKYLMLTVTYTLIGLIVANLIHIEKPLFDFFVNCIVALIVPNFFNYLLFSKSKSFQYFKKVLLDKFLLRKGSHKL